MGFSDTMKALSDPVRRRRTAGRMVEQGVRRIRIARADRRDGAGADDLLLQSV